MQCGALRAHAGAARSAVRQLRAQAAYQGRPSDVEGSEAAGADLRVGAFECAQAIIERYRRRESSVEEALIEMYLAGVSVRRVEDITEALWGTRVSPSTVSDLNKKIYGTIEAWRNRPIGGQHPYVYLDGIRLHRR